MSRSRLYRDFSWARLRPRQCHVTASIQCLDGYVLPVRSLVLLSLHSVGRLTERNLADTAFDRARPAMMEDGTVGDMLERQPSVF